MKFSRFNAEAQRCRGGESVKGRRGDNVTAQRSMAATKDAPPHAPQDPSSNLRVTPDMPGKQGGEDGVWPVLSIGRRTELRRSYRGIYGMGRREVR